MSAAFISDYVLINSKKARVKCPTCSPRRKTENEETLSIKDFGDRVVWHCWHCPEKGAVRRFQSVDKPVKNVEKIETVVPLRSFVTTSLSEEGVTYLESRGITRLTANACNIVSGAKMYRKSNAVLDSVGFVYNHNNQDYAIKWRAVASKEFTQEGAAATLYLADKLTNRERLVITEGEMDALSFWEAGVEAVSIPSGAIQSASKDESARLKWMALHDDLISGAKDVYLAVDADSPGVNTANELARRIGKAKCWQVMFPPGCKDANDVLIKHGREALADCITNASRWPIEGVASANDFADKVLRLYTSGLPRGLSTGWLTVDEIYTLNPGNLVVITGVPGHGKALALDTEILTDNGWKTMGTISVGDRVYAPDGTLTNVVRVSDILHDRECYRVSFKDGAEVVADAEHQWVTRNEKARNSFNSNKAKRGDRPEILPRGNDQTHKRTFPSSKTTKEIANTLTFRGRINHAVVCNKPLAGSRQWGCAIAPYTLGAWLGDGTSSNGGFTSADEEIISYIKEDGYNVVKNKSVLRYHIHDIVRLLSDCGVLNNKHIPEELLFADVDSRTSLLRGLMDTDGSPCAGGGMSEFCTINKQLGDGVFALAASLGLRPKMYIGRATINGKDCGEKYRIVMANIINPFRLSRKANKVNVSSRSFSWHQWQQIVDVKLEPSVPVRCIMVDHPSHEFLVTRHLVPTHNSTFLDALLVNAMKTHNWSVAYASFENPQDIHISKLIAQKVNKPFGFGPQQRMDEGEMLSALSWVNDHVTFLTNDGVMPTVESLIERFETAVRRYGVKACVVDPFNFIKLPGKEGGFDTESINEMLSSFKMFAQRAEVVFFLVAHPAKPMAGNTDFIPTGYSISGSAHFYNRADFGLTMQRKNNESILHVWKARFAHQGRLGQCTLEYDPPTGGFFEPNTLLSLPDFSAPTDPNDFPF